MRQYLVDPLWRFAPVFIWGVCLLTLVALLFGAIFGFFAESTADGVPADSWERLAADREGFWGPIVQGVGFERAIELIETNVPAAEQGQALHELLALSRFAPLNDAVPAPQLFGTDDETKAQLKKAEEEKRVYDAKRLVQLREIRRVLDTVEGNQERIADYATLVQEFSVLGASDDSLSAYKRVVEEIGQTGGRWERIKEWFLPLLNERIALTVCGLMALVVYLLRPTVAIWAKALAYRLHGRNSDPNIQRALGNAISPRPQLVVPEK